MSKVFYFSKSQRRGFKFGLVVARLQSLNVDKTRLSLIFFWLMSLTGRLLRNSRSRRPFMQPVVDLSAPISPAKLRLMI